MYLIHPNYFIDVPCGKCLECQKRKFRDYRIRLLYEIHKYPNSIFITLTFDDFSLSKYKDNPNKTISLFLDRIRKRYGKQVRHWIVAEFGSKRGRLHYHGILFDIDIKNEELFSLWKYGNTFVGYANEITAKYIVKYVTKQDTKGIAPPRVISSKGIGLGWLDTPECKLAYLQKQKLFYINGLPTPIPRFYIEKMYNKTELDELAYYYYQETPKPTTFYLLGREYNSEKQFLHAKKNLLTEYKKQGYLFDNYVTRERGISKETRYLISLNVYSKYNTFDNFNL